MKSPLRGRSRLEQLLFLLLVVMFICLLALSITVGIRNRRGWTKWGKHECVTPECIETAHQILSWRDPNVDPCDDFYQYACRKWYNETVAIDENRNRFAATKEELTMKLKDIMESEEIESDPFPEHFKKTQQFYKACMNISNRQSEGMTEFLEDAKYVGGYPVLKGPGWDHNSFSVMTAVARMVEKGFESAFLFTLGSDFDARNNSIERIVITQTTLGLPKAEYFQSASLVALYTNFVSVQAHYLCHEDAPNCIQRDLDGFAQELVEATGVEKHLAEIRVDEALTRKKEYNYNVMKVSELQEMAPGINWLQYLKIFFPNVTEDDEILVMVPDFLKAAAAYLEELERTPDGKRKLANYLMYRQAKEMSLHTTVRMRELYYQFQSGMTGDIDSPQLWKECQSITKPLLEFSLAAMYAKKFFPKEKKELVEELMEGIREELGRILMETSWMDDDTREEALKKLENLYVIAGYPDAVLDDEFVSNYYQQLTVGANHYENVKNGQGFLTLKHFGTYGFTPDRSRWTNLPQSLLDVNAAYNPANNSLVVPLAIAQGFFFEENRPKYANYGRLGTIIGHEFGHAFDTEGADFDEGGNWRNWWQNGTMDKFKESSKCMIDIFDSYRMDEHNLTLNGTLTLTENIADDLGVTQVYRAFVKASKRDGESRLPGVDLNINQLFWINTAMTWCEKQEQFYYELLTKGDVHSPSRFRVLSPLSNNEDFLRDFGCKRGTKMNMHRDKCHVWGV